MVGQYKAWVATALTVYGIETCGRTQYILRWLQLQQHLPFTVCAAGGETAEEQSDDEVRTSQVPERSEGKTKVMRQQRLPFTVLKPVVIITIKFGYLASCNSPYRLRYWNKVHLHLVCFDRSLQLQQHLPFTVCAEGCETTEEQSDDEVSTSQVPERSEGKTKAIR